jgi:hypothetical protein
VIFLIALIAMRNIWNQKIIKITGITVQTKFLQRFKKTPQQKTVTALSN